MALATFFPLLPRLVFIAGLVSAVVPDIDSVAVWLGAEYAGMFGRRGFTHSPFFALTWATAVASLLRSRTPLTAQRSAWLYLFSATASHGIFDSMSDAGLGVAFFAPFSAERYFLPFRPIRTLHASPSGSLARAAEIMRSEAEWVWAPSVAVALVVVCIGELRPKSTRSR